MSTNLPPGLPDAWDDGIGPEGRDWEKLYEELEENYESAQGVRDRLQRIAELEAEAAALRAVVAGLLDTCHVDGCEEIGIWAWSNHTEGEFAVSCEQHKDTQPETGAYYDPEYAEEYAAAQAALASNAGERLLEAVRVLAEDSVSRVSGDWCVHCGLGEENCYYANQDHEFLSRRDQARAKLHELGVLEGE